MQLRGMSNPTPEELMEAVAAGGRFVFFEYCISILFVTLRRPTDIYFLRRQERGLRQGFRFALLSLLLGWWGIPWGFIYTPLTMLSNLTGGRDVTAAVLAWQAKEPAVS